MRRVNWTITERQHKKLQQLSRETGLPISELVRRSLDKYLGLVGEEPLGPAEADEEKFVPKNQVRQAYQAYAEAEDLPRIPENEFGRRLMELRDFRIESSQKRVDHVRTQVYDGVVLSPRGRQLIGLDDPKDGQSQVDRKVPDAKEAVLDRLIEMVDANDGDPVPKEGLIWGAVGEDISKVRAESAFNQLKQRGDIIEQADGIIYTS